ncbi:MAG TPA: molybdate ABC transporter substrate-binding protein, partial [Microvirga sp.]|nr:molybdate ABC transporter substrate-binding protein [Microvirga sp.]
MAPVPVRRSASVRAVLFRLAVACFALVAAPAQAKDVVVFAAASLKNALDDAGAAWERETGRKPVIS